MVAELEADFIERLAMLQRSRMSSLHVAAIAQASLAWVSWSRVLTWEGVTSGAE